MIQAKFGLNWPSGFRGEDFWKSLQTDDRRQVKAIAHTGELKITKQIQWHTDNGGKKGSRWKIMLRLLSK
jgi:hypothetical protein